MKPRRSLEIGDLVLIADENVHRGKWPLGKVVDVFRGKDGYVRSAKVKTSLTVLTRPVTKLCFLEGQSATLNFEKKTNLFFFSRSCEKEFISSLLRILFKDRGLTLVPR